MKFPTHLREITMSAATALTSQACTLEAPVTVNDLPPACYVEVNGAETNVCDCAETKPELKENEELITSYGSDANSILDTAEAIRKYCKMALNDPSRYAPEVLCTDYTYNSQDGSFLFGGGGEKECEKLMSMNDWDLTWDYTGTSSYQLDLGKFHGPVKEVKQCQKPSMYCAIPKEYLEGSK